jgi:hypothetical protein
LAAWMPTHSAVRVVDGDEDGHLPILLGEGCRRVVAVAQGARGEGRRSRWDFSGIRTLALREQEAREPKLRAVLEPEARVMGGPQRGLGWKHEGPARGTSEGRWTSMASHRPQRPWVSH